MTGRAEETVLIVGAAGAIGTVICQVLAERGIRVHAADASDPSAVVAGLAGSVPHRADVVDVTDRSSVEDLLGSAWDPDDGPLTGVVYAAGANYTGYVAATSWPDYERVMAVNVRGAFHVGQALSRRLIDQPRTLSTVWLSSVAGLVGEAGGSVYVASKFALIGFVQSLAAEIAASGGRANAVCPGNVDSPMLRTLVAKVAEREHVAADALLTDWQNATSFRRLITPLEVARTCAWLLSPDASGISGQSIVVDGPVAAGDGTLP